jgi:hypothetical protein
LDLLEFIEVLKVAVDQWFIGQGPQMLICLPSCKQGIRAYIPIPDVDHRPEFFSSEAFAYDADHDVYLYPAGKELHARSPSIRAARSLRNPNLCQRLQSLLTQSTVYNR